MRAVQGVDMLNIVDGFAGADAVGVVAELDHRVGFLHFLQLPPMPGKLVLLERGGIADLVVGNGCRANGGQLVARPCPPAEPLALRGISVVLGMPNGLSDGLIDLPSIGNKTMSKILFLQCCVIDFRIVVVVYCHSFLIDPFHTVYLIHTTHDIYTGCSQE